MKLKILTGALALLLTGSVLTGFSTQAAPSKAESDDHLAQEISEAVFRMDGATAQVSYDGGSTWDTSPTVELPDFYSYEEFAGWIETESDNLQANLLRRKLPLLLLSINPHCLGSRTKYRLASEVLMKRTKFSLVCLIIRSPRFFRQSCMTVTVIGTLARIIQKLNCMRPWSNTQTIRLNLEI